MIPYIAHHISILRCNYRSPMEKHNIDTNAERLERFESVRGYAAEVPSCREGVSKGAKVLIAVSLLHDCDDVCQGQGRFS